MGERSGTLRSDGQLAAGGQQPDDGTRSEQERTLAGGSQADLQEKRAELEHIRADMSETIEAIQARLTPDQLAREGAIQVRQQVRRQQARVAGGLGSIAQAFREASHQLRAQDQGAVAQYATRAAEQVDHVSAHIRDRDVRQLVGEVERFARRQPTLFVGSAFAVGLLSARFLKSSSPARATMGGREPATRAHGGDPTDVSGPGLQGRMVEQTEATRGEHEPGLSSTDLTHMG